MKRCPQCRSADVTLYMGGQFGKYLCKKCGYIGVLIIDEPKGRKTFQQGKNHSKAF